MLLRQNEEDALCTWTTMTFDKSFGKWSVGLMTEYRHKFHEGVSKTDQYFARPRVAYKALPWLTLRYQVDFASTSSGFNLCFNPEVTFTHKVGDFSQRVMTTWKVEQGTNSTLLRTRAKVDYRIPETPLTDNLTLVPQYIYQAYHNRQGKYSRRTYDDHVIYMTFLIKL